MYRASRAVATLAAVGIAGVLLWAATYFERNETYGYWAAYGIVAAAGLVVALAQIRGRSGNPPLMLLLVFVPTLIAAGWVLLAMQPNANWFRNHVLTWSGNIGIRDLVADLVTWLGVLAFGIGYTFGLVLEPAPAPVEEEVVAPMAPGAYDRRAADEPTTAERREVVTEDGRVREAERVR
jgi:drug/metabolite transporter (DMT)-like permease